MLFSGLLIKAVASPYVSAVLAHIKAHISTSLVVVEELIDGESTHGDEGNVHAEKLSSMQLLFLAYLGPMFRK